MQNEEYPKSQVNKAGIRRTVMWLVLLVVGIYVGSILKQMLVTAT
jgi:hypothetical protein